MAIRRRKAGLSGSGPTIAASPSLAQASLDDRPLEIRASRDGKWLFVSLPWELWIMSAADLAFQRAIELAVPHPHVAEGPEGVLWIAGKHLYRGSTFNNTVSKFGTKLGGFAHKVALLQPHFLCCLGPSGELLFDLEDERVLHQRKHSHRNPCGLVASADERAIYVDGESSAWVIDPAHPDGYMRLRLRNTSEAEVFAEGLVLLAVTEQGRVILAARDGAVAWTTPDLRLAKERVPATADVPLAAAGDHRWVYVLRPRGLIQRFLIEQPVPAKADRAQQRRKRGPAEPHRMGKTEPEPEPLPLAQSCRLERPATTLALVASKLVLGGPRADNQLGRLWRVDPESLDWKDLGLGRRVLMEPDPDKSEHATPSFIATKTKLAGDLPKIADIDVDHVLTGSPGFWVTHGHGSLVDRPVTSMDATEVKPQDALLLPAMVRFREGTARPALLLWPGVADQHREPPALQWLVWGDEPRGWMPLETPEIRTQKWTRSGVFPLQAALAGTPPSVEGSRASLPKRWADPELFAALVKECKRLLVVLW